MSQSADKSSDESLVQPSKFGRRLGLIVAIMLIVLAAVAAIGTFATGDSNQSSQPVPSTNTF